MEQQSSPILGPASPISPRLARPEDPPGLTGPSFETDRSMALGPGQSPTNSAADLRPTGKVPKQTTADDKRSRFSILRTRSSSSHSVDPLQCSTAATPATRRSLLQTGPIRQNYPHKLSHAPFQRLQCGERACSAGPDRVARTTSPTTPGVMPWLRNLDSDDATHIPYCVHGSPPCSCRLHPMLMALHRPSGIAPVVCFAPRGLRPYPSRAHGAARQSQQSARAM
jgi:hypothetical protein